MGQEPRVPPANRAGGGVALLHKDLEQPALVLTQVHGILLGHGSLLSGGEYAQEH